MVSKVGDASTELGKVAEKAATDGSDKDGPLSKAIREAVDAAKNTLKELKKHLEDLKDIGDANQKVGEAVGGGGNEGTPADDGELKKVLKALAFQGIVKVAADAGVPEPVAGEIAVKVGSADNKDGIKILATNSSNKPSSAGNESKAAAILTTVSGENILASIVASKESDAVLGSSAPTETTTAISFAKGGDSGSQLATNSTPKASAVAGGIALRSLVKAGKLAAGAADGNAGGKEEVQGVGITAANKLLVAVEDIIKKTVKNVLETAKQKIDEARKSKSVGNE